MNLQKITALRDHLVNNVEQENFNMSTWIIRDGHTFGTLNAPIPTIDTFKDHPCGTVACLAGHVVIANKYNKNSYADWSRNHLISIDKAAALLLDLNYMEERHLFFGHWFDLKRYVKSDYCESDNKVWLSRRLTKDREPNYITDILPAISVNTAIQYLDKVIEENDIFVKIIPNSKQPRIDGILEKVV